MGNPLGVYETNYMVKSEKNIIGENMASFRFALSRVIFLYSSHITLYFTEDMSLQVGNIGVNVLFRGKCKKLALQIESSNHFHS